MTGTRAKARDYIRGQTVVPQCGSPMWFPNVVAGFSPRSCYSVFPYFFGAAFLSFAAGGATTCKPYKVLKSPS